MAIEFSQIHNLVRTYQRALRSNSEPRAPQPAAMPAPDDQITISAEARAREGASNETAPPPPPQ